jgi:hypothetical protein
VISEVAIAGSFVDGTMPVLRLAAPTSPTPATTTTVTPGGSLIDRIAAGTLKATDVGLLDGGGSQPSSAPSIGIGYSPPAPAVLRASSDLAAPATAADSTPTTLPTVTVIGSKITSHWQIVAAIALALLLFVAYRRWKG